MDSKDFHHWSRKAADWGVDYRDSLRALPVRAQAKPGDIARQIGEAPPEQRSSPTSRRSLFLA
jgi:aromatic-L-amino-acid/L-tryptophan decarboxylase